MLDNYITLEGLFTTVLYTHVDFDSKSNTTKYQFVTNRTEKYPAKSPFGLFDELYIRNDLGFVLQKIREFNEEAV